MNELQTIVELFEEAEKNDLAAVLATVIRVSGSTYRRPGARLLINADGTTIGSISGGCLEGDVKEYAVGVFASAKPALVKYDTMSDEDIVWGLGLGCNGVIHVLIESLTKGSSGANQIGFIADCWRHQHIGVVATIVEVDDSIDAFVGARLMQHQNGTAYNDIKDSYLAARVLEDSLVALKFSRSQMKLYQLPSGEAEVFIEVIEPPVPLAIFGAGDDAIPLANLARLLGWYVTVVDTHARTTTRKRFPGVDVVLCRPDSIDPRMLNNRTVAVVMSHNYLHDLELLRVLLPSAVRYIGVLGPKSRTERLLQELVKEGMSLTSENLRRLYSPVGIDIGADTPDEIALSIVAEIRAVLANRLGGFLKDRSQPIHNRS